MSNLQKSTAAHFLRTVDEGIKFFFCNGKNAYNIRELLDGIFSISDEEFLHHVYFDHNDFTNWLLDIIGDDKLARDIFSSTRDQTIALLKARIHFLEHHSK